MNAIEPRTGGAAIIETLTAFGVDTVFGIPGVHNLTIYEALRQSNDIRHVLNRHEQGVGFMADGYSRVTGKVGVGVIISGPGVTNALTPLAGAFAESSAVLIIATGLDFDGDPMTHGTLHEVRNQFEMASATAGWAKRVDNPDDVATAVAAALTHLSTERPRGAYLQISLNAMDSLTSAPVPIPNMAPARAADAANLRQAAEMLGGAERPLIMAGSGVVAARGAAELIALAERLGAPVILGPKSNDLLATGHPLRYTLPRFHQNADIEAVISDADVVLAIGTKLGEERTSRSTHTLTSKLIRIDLDAGELQNRYPADLGICADAREALSALSAELGAAPREPWADLETARASQQARLVKKHGDRLAHLDAVRAALPDNGILVADMTMLGYAASEYFAARQPYRFMHPYQLCSIGHGFPMAIGARVGSGTDPVVVLCGDGGVLQTFTELVPAVESQIPVVFVVFNDQTYSAVKAAQVKTDPAMAIATDLVSPNFALLAEAMGAHGEHVNTPAELADAITNALTRTKPSVIEVSLLSYP